MGLFIGLSLYLYHSRRPAYNAAVLPYLPADAAHHLHPGAAFVNNGQQLPALRTAELNYHRRAAS